MTMPRVTLSLVVLTGCPRGTGVLYLLLPSSQRAASGIL